MQVVEEVGNSFFDNEFAKINSRTCTLLLNFNEEGFSYSILKNESNEILFSAVSNAVLDIYHFNEAQLSEIFQTETVFKYTYGKIIVLIDTIFSTLVPLEFFDQASLRKYLDFNLKLPSTDLRFHFDSFSNLPYKNIYVNALALEQSLAKNFVETHVKASESVLLEFLDKKNVSNEYFHLHLSLKKMHCCFFKNKEIVFNNIFSFETDEDILYNVLNTYKQLGLNNEMTNLNVSGIISEDSSKYDLLYKYIKYITFAKRPLKLNFSESLAQMPEHYFLHHYAALL